jgi:hypothetical protein
MALGESDICQLSDVTHIREIECLRETNESKRVHVFKFFSFRQFFSYIFNNFKRHVV